MENSIDYYKHFSWLRKVNLHSAGNPETYQEQLSRLERDKESLIVQVGVLTDQVEAQGAKIRNLQSSLVEHQHKLNYTEEMLQQELLHRTSLESQKLSLRGEVSYLKLKLADMDSKHSHETERQHKAEALKKELRVLRDKVDHLEDQKLLYERKLKATKAEITSLQQLLLSKNAEIESLHLQLLARPALCAESLERDQELHRLRSGMKLLLAANDEKDRRIEELTMLLNQCKQFREVTPHRQAPSAVHSLSNGRTPSSSSEEEEQRLMKNADSSSAKSVDVKSDVSTSSSSSQQKRDPDFRQEQRTSFSSMHNLTNGSSQKSRLSDSRSQTLPVTSSPSDQNGTGDSSSEIQSQRSPDGSEDGDSQQSKLEKVNDCSTSDNSPAHSETSTQHGQRVVGSPEYMKNNRSFKRLWGKLRRTQSGGIQAVDPDTNQFKRGGLRATAGPRLIQTPDSHDSARDMNTPFSQWTKNQVCGWLEDYGLGQYVNLTRQWVENGQMLLSATPQDFEKEMGMKNPLHRKKLQLAMKSFSTRVIEKSSELDHIWVTCWLDDIGLPQYKDQFHEARVDGRMIQYLTVNDLLTLKVTSQLHHLSIKCAIHVLHANKFNPNCLRRRPGEEKQPSPSEVVQWSNHCVMEWLRAVDLAEYAPNLRGSGVHGGLIILEPRFSSETLALLLNIPPQKTLLRRHLATAFSALVGPQATQEKREYGNATGHIPLTTTAKVKPKKLGFTQFSHLRKRKPDESDYICPIDSGALIVNGVSRFSTVSHRGLSPNLDNQAERREQFGEKN
ncbi:liprin-beta-2 isoform X2 [Thalassophryne amazonica]|uniref:liprin-beta-2 isoform X2 n=1 Tax=Thalassophryne amazonica TaxID=390379 RepID=UPI001471D1AC|nr:liprin-beta-2 isoform X2 [Thalassophryne amazonica]